MCAHSFIHSNYYLLSIYYVSGTMLVSGDRAENKTDKTSSSDEADILEAETRGQTDR